MSFEHQLFTGNGTLDIVDATDWIAKLVDLYFITGQNEYRTQDIPWKYAIDGVESSWQNFHFVPPNPPGYTHIAQIYVGFAQQFTFSVGDAGFGNFGGGNIFWPADFTVDLIGNSDLKTLRIKVDGVWKQAIPFVNVAGVWKPAAPYVMLNSEWKEAR